MHMNENIILIDQEQPENAFAIGYFALGLIFRPAGKETVPLVPPGSEAAAQLLEAGLYPCDDRNLSDFPFYPVPSLTLFGEDEYGTVYGLVGGCDDDAPVGSGGDRHCRREYRGFHETFVSARLAEEDSRPKNAVVFCDISFPPRSREGMEVR